MPFRNILRMFREPRYGIGTLRNDLFPPPPCRICRRFHQFCGDALPSQAFLYVSARYANGILPFFGKHNLCDNRPSFVSYANTFLFFKKFHFVSFFNRILHRYDNDRRPQCHDIQFRPDAIPTPAVAHTPAAVVSPRISCLRYTMIPAPRKPIPDTICAVTRDAS